MESNLESIKSRSVASNSYQYVRNITHIKQNNGYYCGPACIQMAAKAISSSFSSSASTQSGIAAYVGTNSTDGTYYPNMLSGLNNYTPSDFNWTQILVYSADDLNEYTYNSLRSYYTPVYNIIGQVSGGMPYYSSTRHYVVGYGIESTAIHIDDPFLGLNDNWYNCPTGKYPVFITGLYNSMKNAYPYNPTTAGIMWG